MQEVGWDRGGFLLLHFLLLHKRIISAVKTVEFVTDRI
jgi:hypothetical protein